MAEAKRCRRRIWRGLTLLMAAAVGVGGAAAAESVVTYHGSADRSGLYVAPTLTWTKAATVRLDPGFHATVDGAVYAQPLYWVPPGGGAARIIVATENNKVYALDAGTGAKIWERSLGTPVPLSALPCGNIDPMGVTGTPTIDPAAWIVYLEAFVQTPTGGPRHKVFGLSLATGKRDAGLAGRRRERARRAGPRLQQRAPRAAQRAHPGQRQALRPLCRARRRLRRIDYHGMVVGLDLAQPASVRRVVDPMRRWRQLGTERRRLRRHVHVRDHRQRPSARAPPGAAAKR